VDKPRSDGQCRQRCGSVMRVDVITTVENSRGVYTRLTPCSKSPLPFPFPIPFPPPLPSSPLPSPRLRSRPPLLQLGGLGERFSSPSGSAKWYLVNFRLKISPLVATNKCIKLMHFPPKLSAKTLPLLFPRCICSIVYME